MTSVSLCDEPEIACSLFQCADHGKAALRALQRLRLYHTALIAGGWICLVIFNLLRFPDPWHWLFFLTLPLFAVHLYFVWTREDKALDPMLPMLVMSTFALSVLMGLGYLMFLI